MKIAVVGAGAMGRWSVKELATSPEVDGIVVADLSEDRARRVARLDGSHKATSSFVDAGDETRESLKRVLAGCDAVINCTSHLFNMNVMHAAAEAGAHYTDMGGLFHYSKLQVGLDDEFKKAGVTAVIAMGAAPGLTNVLAGYGAARLDVVREAHARCACIDETDWSSYPGWVPPYALGTICDEFLVTCPQFLNGEWDNDVTAGAGEELVDFGAPLGVLPAHHTIHSEPFTFWHTWRHQGLQTATWKLALPSDLTTQMRFLARIGMVRTDAVEVDGVTVRPQSVLLKVVDELPKPSDVSLRVTAVLMGIVRGQMDGREVEWRARLVAPPPEGVDDAGIGVATGVPPAIVAKMMARGDIREPGVFVPEQIVPADMLFSELGRWGMKVDASMTEVLV